MNKQTMDIHRQDLLDEITTRVEFENGLRLVIQEYPVVPVVAVQAFFKAGSIFESAHLGAGLSHFVEHMAFKGTRTQKPGDLARRIQGAGGSINAYTSCDRTVYHGTVKSEFAHVGLEVLSDAIQHSIFDPRETRKEQAVIVKELERDLEEPDARLWELFLETRYTVHPYRLPVGGYISEFKKVTREELVQYYHRYYIPNNMILVVVGDIEKAAIVEQVQKLFVSFERSAAPLFSIPDEPEQMAPRRAYKELLSLREDIRLKWGFPGVSTFHPHLFALDVLSLILGRGESSRLTQRLKYQEQLVTGVQATNYSPLYPGFFHVDAMISQSIPDGVEKTCRILWEEAQILQDQLVSESELSRARNQVLMEYLFHRETMQDRAMSLGIYELFLSNPLFDKTYVEKIQEVTAVDIQKAAQTYLIPAREIRAVVAPFANVPEPSPPSKLASSSPSTGILRTRGRGKEEHLESSHSMKDKKPVHEMRLGQGVRLFLHENHAQPVLALYAVLRGGSQGETTETMGLSHIMAQMLLQGTAQRSAREIATLMENLGGSLDAESGRMTFGLQAAVLSPHVETALDLFTDCLLHPTFPQGELENQQRILLNQISVMDEDPLYLAFREFRRQLFGTHSYAFEILGQKKTVESFHPEDVRRFYERSLHPQNLVIGVSGDITADRLRSYLEKALSGLTAENHPFLIPKKTPRLPSGPRQKKLTHRGAELTVVALGFRTVDMCHPARYALELVDHLFSGLAGRLFERIREKEGLAYETSSTTYYGTEAGFLAVYARVDEERTRRVLDLFQSEIEALKKKPLPSRELQRVKHEVSGNYLRWLQRNSYHAMSMALNELYGLGYDYGHRFIDALLSVTARDIQEAARTYLDFSKAVTIQVSPPKADS